MWKKKKIYIYCIINNLVKFIIKIININNNKIDKKIYIIKLNKLIKINNNKNNF